MLLFFFTRAAEMDPVKDRYIFALLVNYFAKLALPILGIALVSALFSNIAQVGFLFTLKPLAFKFERIIPNLGQYFSKTL